MPTLEHRLHRAVNVSVEGRQEMAGFEVSINGRFWVSTEARGKAVDKRADIWAFGVVLYEMLAWQRPFKGEDTTDTIVAVASKDPDWSALPPGTPPSILKLLRRCLEKDRKRRLDSAAAVRLEIEDALTTPTATAAIAQPATRARLPWAVAGLLGVALVATLLALARWRPVPLLPETRVDIVTPGTDSPTAFALSPDGSQIVFVAWGDGASRLWLRSLATMTTQPLMGTEEATGPFWAPDSRAIGFFAGGTLKRLDLGGGTPQTLAPAFAGRGGAWNADGVIVFAPSVSGHLMRVSATGGAAVAVTTLAAQQANHRWPHMLPDGRRFLFYAQGVPDATGIYLSALDGSAPTRLTPADSAGVYHPSGWLLWVRAGTLVAQRLDVTHGALTGETVTLADGVTVDGFFRSAVSVAATGLLAYRTGTSRRQLIWLDRSGTARGTIGEPDDKSLREPRASPNGRRVAVGRAVQGNFDVWLLDDTRMSRLTSDGALDLYPVWSPDGTRIVFRSNRSGQGDLYQKLTSNTGMEKLLVGSDQQKSPTSWSSDGRFLLYHSTYPQADTDLWIVPMAGDPTPAVFLKTPFREEWGAFSPDGRWVAYQSDESGRVDIYVRPFAVRGAPGTAGGQWQVSTAGGTYPVWRPDGKELYYLNPAGAMMAAPITVTESSLEPGAPMVLFSTRILGGGALAQDGRHYDVAPDGRFLINMVRDDAAAPITLLMNWRPETTK